MVRILAVLALLILTASTAGAAADPFAKAVKDCHPCRFSPGNGAPAFDLIFGFTGTGDDRALTAFDIAPAGGGPSQRLDTGGIAVSDFAGGFSIDAFDLNRDGYRDLGLVTATSADNDTEEYWLYEPKNRRFVALERDEERGGDCPLSWDAKAAALTCHVKSSAADYTDYWYRIAGHRTVAVRRVDQAVTGDLLVHRTTDLAVKPPRLVKTVTVGFVGDSPERTAFLKRLHAAAGRAARLYRRGDKSGALATMAAMFKDIRPYALGNGGTDKPLAADLDDYGFYLEAAGHHYDAIDPLQDALEADPDRTVAYLNLGDTFYAIGNKDGAQANYAEYRKRMLAAGKAAKVPPRVAERLR